MLKKLRGDISLSNQVQSVLRLLCGYQDAVSTSYSVGSIMWQMRNDIAGDYYSHCVYGINVLQLVLRSADDIVVSFCGRVPCQLLGSYFGRVDACMSMQFRNRNHCRSVCKVSAYVLPVCTCKTNLYTRYLISEIFVSLRLRTNAARS